MGKNLPVLTLLVLINYLVLSGSAFGQGQTNVWYMGNGAGLDFNTVPPTRLQNGNSGLMTYTGEGVGAMSDANGNLLFYTNGSTVYNRNHAVMPNGTGLNGNGTTVQTGTIVPMIGNANQYYIISPSQVDSAAKYSVVDMTLNGGLGDVVVASKNTLLMAHASEACLAIPHSNGTDFWVLLHASLTATYHVFLFTSSGVTGPTNYVVGSIPQATMLMKVNSCYTKIATVLYNKTKVEVVSFNNSTGVVSGTAIKTITNFINPECYGAEFSPSGRFLYVTEAGLNNRRTVHQFDLNAGNDAAINASNRFYTASATIARMGHLQMGPDAKIYVPGYTTVAPSYMSVIPNPDVQWTSPTPTATEYEHLKYTFSSTRVGEGLPAVIRKLVTSIHISSTNACAGGNGTGLSYVFGSIASGSAGSITWSFGDGDSATDVTNPTHIYTTAGTYTVTASIIDTCGQLRTSSGTVTIRPGPQVTVPPACPFTNITLSSTSDAASTYIWSDSASMSPILTVGSSYTYNGALPKTIYVQDPTPFSISTVGNLLAPPNGNAGADVGHTYFETYQTLSITSFQIYSRAAGSATLSLQNEAGTTTYWGPTACNPTAASQTFSFTPNVSLPAGRYRLFTSNKVPFFRENNSADGGRDINNVIDVLGEKSGTKGGSFLNIGISLPDPCEIKPILIPSNSCTLPVELVSFNATPDESTINVQWKTESETNSDYFVVEKSDDGKTFSALETVKGAGNSTVPLNYKIIDRHPLKGITYYRLKQVDYNGATSYSKIVDITLKQKQEILVVPNPVKAGRMKIMLPETPSNSCWVSIIDRTGRKVFDKKISPEFFNSSVTISDLHFASSGLYNLNVEIDGIFYSEKITAFSE